MQYIVESIRFFFENINILLFACHIKCYIRLNSSALFGIKIKAETQNNTNGLRCWIHKYFKVEWGDMLSRSTPNKLPRYIFT